MSGKSLADAGKAVGLSAETIAAVDAAGRDPKGAQVNLPDKPELLRAAFASDVGLDEAPLNTKDGGYIWYEIAKVDPAHDLTFEEAKPEVEKQQRAEEIDKALAAKADDLVKQISAGGNIADVAKGAGAEVKTATDVHRAEQASLPELVVAAIFRQPPTAPALRRPPTDGWCSRSLPTGRRRSTSRTPASSRWPPSSKPRPARACSINMSRPCAGRSASRSIRTSSNPPRAAHKPMTTLPDYEAFARRYVAGEAEVAVTTLVADLETPVSAYLKLARGRAGNMFLLESVEGGAQRGRYSMIGLDPDLIFRSSGDHAEINRRALIDPDAFVPCPGDPLDALRALLAESRIEMPPGLPPMSAGVFGYLGYDMVRRMERLAPAKPDPIGVPEALLIRPTVMVVFDGARDELAIVTPVRPAPGVTARAAYESAMGRLDAVVDALESPLDHTGAMAVDPLVKAGEARSNTTEAEYKAMVARAKDYIAAGDAFQIVLSQRFTSRFDLPAFALYRALRRVNPSPYLCFLDFGSFQIVCSSPEILVRVRDGKVVIRPIAGTRPRGKSPTEDEALAAELLADPKERAEHLMLLDLGRNDVGRVAKIGTVKVTDSFFIERYSHVMQIASNVEGELRGSLDAVTALAAGFPAGTVSGAPKSAQCRSSTNWRRTSGTTPAASAISAPAARWTPTSCCAPPW